MLVESEQYVVGYGSLLSHDSRLRYSDLNCSVIPVTLRGWQRAWNTRSYEEMQTYVGAQQTDNGALNGVVLPIREISPELQKREQDYEFVPVNLEELEFLSTCDQHLRYQEVLQGKQIWVCQNVKPQSAMKDYPIYQSYIDTCLAGCHETEIDGFDELFINSTIHWEDHWINDRKKPRYPRAAILNDYQQAAIDALFDDLSLLQFRQKGD